MSKFQVILLGVFGVFIIVGVAVFSLYRGNTGGIGNTPITIWGDIPSYDFNLLLNTPVFGSDRARPIITYVEKPASTISAEFTEALARGTGPDLIILTQERYWTEKAKLVPIPYGNISERDFQEVFVEEGELFLGPEGIYALPLVLDPMVLYYNRDLLSAVGHAKPIAYWDEIYKAATDLSKRDAAGNLISSVMALGESRNIPNAKSILSLLMLQAGTPITTITMGELRPAISASFDLPVLPAQSALDFYTQFSNPSRAYYSWNRSLMDAQTHFTSGDSAYYLGFASEYRTLLNKNPNLNLGVTLVPQSRVSSGATTYGRLYAVGISRGAASPSAALDIALRLISREGSLALSGYLGLPPARRDILAEKPSDTFTSFFYDAALQAKGWIDPNPSATDSIFRNTIDSITSGRLRTLEAVNSANKEVETLLRQ